MFKRLQNIFICMVVASGLSACTVLEKRAEKVAQDRAAHLKAFENQLVKEGEPHATLRFYPPVSRHYGRGSLDPTAINIIRFDNTMITGYEESSYYPLVTPHIPLKVPAGVHTFVIGYAEGSFGYAKFENVNLEAGKHYILNTVSYDRKKRQHTWRVYEYTPDFRFAPNERESVILGEPVSERQVEGNKKDVL